MSLSFLKSTCSSVTFLFIFLLTLRTASGQLFLIGTDPGKIKWNQVKTPNFKVIYPRHLEGKGQYIASGLEYNYLPGSRTLNTLAPRTPVIIHPYTTVPSSVTYIAPRRMEFFTTPPQDIYPQDWTDQLIIHEFRHAVQYSSVNKGFSKGLSWVLGEFGTLFGVYGLFIPMWFMEGDATVTETALHYTGRGRTPSFEMKLRAQFIEKGAYSYEKACYGSFGEFVPNKYELGYQLVGWSRVYFGKDLWAGVMTNVAKKPFTLTPFSSSLKKQTGLNKYQLYDTITRRMIRTWINEDKTSDSNSFLRINDPKRMFYSNYNLPVIFRDSLIIAVKSSPDFLTKAVSIDKNGKERYLFTAGANYYSESLSVSDSVLYWSELVNDPRWFLRDYRVIKTYSFNSGRISQLTHKTRYFAPSVSNNKKNLVVVEADPENNYSLVLLKISDGSIEKRFTTPDNLLFIHPSWSENDSLIVSVVFGKEGNSIAATDLKTGKSEILFPFSFMEMKRPSFYRNFIIYTASYDGRDNIYALNRETHEIFRITSSRFGVSDAFVSENEDAIICTDYTVEGYNIVKVQLDTTKWERISVPSHSAFTLAEKLTQQEGFIYNSDSVPKITYPSKPYKKILNKINIHSWAPVGLDIQNISAAPGITLFSQNLLETTVLSTGYLYYRNEKSSLVFMNLSDEGRYTAIDFRLEYATRADTGIYTDNETIPEKWKEFNISPGFRIPLYWTRGPWIRKLSAAINVNFKFLEMEEEIPVEFRDEVIIAPGYTLLASNELKTSYRDIYPRWSQEIQVNYNHTPFGTNQNSIFAGQLKFDMPGIFVHHGFRLYIGYQKKLAETYPFQDYIVFPRGYSEIFGEEISSYSAMYTLPLFYPDWRIKYFTYLKRVKASLFYDRAKSTDNLKTDFFSSAGIDLTFDFNLFNVIVPLEAGVRSAYLIEAGKPSFGFLFSLNFGGMY
jgi:hypothetical protein